VSSNGNCPSCGRAIDPLRAPSVKIVGGKVVAYCSSDCKLGVDHTPLPGPLPEPADDESGLPAPSQEVAPVAQFGLEGDITPVPAPPALRVPPSAPRPRGRARRVVLLAAAVAAAAAGVVVVQRASRDAGGAPVLASSTAVAAPHAAAAAPPPAPEPPAPEPPAPQPRRLDRRQLLEEARRTLSASLADESARVRLLAAMALSRTGDPAALAELERALTSDESEIRRLEVAYALARAGQPHGTDALVAALRASRRDVRLQAARALAQLRDPRGVPRLREALSINQLRLGAAETLATLGDEKATAVLEQALGSPVAETRMRAAVALGRAGNDRGRALLEDLVADARLGIGAEGALARLGDRAAVPALTRALGLSALRVPAALGLRRLGVDVDLTVLADALVTSDEMARISAAEAALVLCSETPPAELE
jgi:HEAT repeat protein